MIHDKFIAHCLIAPRELMGFGKPPQLFFFDVF